MRGVAEAAEVAAAEPAEDAEAVEAAAVAVVRHGELAAGARLSRSPVTLTGAHRYGWAVVWVPERLPRLRVAKVRVPIS